MTFDGIISVLADYIKQECNQKLRDGETIIFDVFVTKKSDIDKITKRGDELLAIDVNKQEIPIADLLPMRKFIIANALNNYHYFYE